MTYPTLETVNLTEDLTGVFLYANTVTNDVFMPLVLFAFFLIAMFGNFFAQQRLGGKGDMVVSFAVAGYLTAGLSFIMMLREGLLNPLYSVISIVIAIVGTIWLYFDRKDS